MKMLAFAALCACTEPGVDFPIEPSAGGSGAVGSSQGSNTQPLLRGRVCVVDDVFTRACAVTGADGLTVALGDQTTITNIDGSFAITNTGSILATLTRGGVPVSGVTATSLPTPAFGPFFDGTEPTPWSINATGVQGTVWFPGINAGPADLTFVTGTGGEAIVGGVQVVNGGITMVETTLP
jgi:hypothetical protein